ADSADDVHVREGEFGQEVRERAHRAELVEDPLDPAAREAKRDLASCLLLEHVPDALADLTKGAFRVVGGDDAGDAEATRLEGEPRSALIRIDHQPDLLPPDRSTKLVGVSAEQRSE